MKRLITPDDVLRLAYSSSELLPSTIVLDVDIIEAECRHVAPVLGKELVERLEAGEYEALMNNYVAPAIALWTRYGVEQVAYHRSAACHDERPTAADNERLRTTLRALSEKASTLTRRLSDHLNAHGDDYPEYDPIKNPLNRCFIYGNIVEIL
jgi:hypothetical protein